MENLKRSSGILLHITSLPNKFGWGNFSSSAFRFVDFLKCGGFGVWQVLPFSECLFGNSPYSSLSSFAINPRFLDFTQFLTDDELIEIGLNDCKNMDDFGEKVNIACDKVAEKLLGQIDTKEFEKANKDWVSDYALFKVIKQSQKNKPWFEWNAGLKNRVKADIDTFKLSHKKEIDKQILIQYLLDTQWKKIKSYANENGVQIFGDMPYYVELDSVDVWVNPKYWQLENGKPKQVAGVPPDYFNSEGQLWGNPIYNFSAMAKKNYDYFVKKVKRRSELFDILRIDHFVAFSRYWSVPAGETSAKSGKWVKGAGASLLKLITSKTKITIVAEDLGIVTNDVIELKEKFKIAGLKVIQFAFDGVGDNMYQPHNYEKNCVAYLGTHDNNTTMGLLNQGDWDKINRIKKYLNMPLQEGNDSVIENLILALYKSSANLIVFTAQDLMHLGEDCRLNIPGKPNGNWEWQLKGDMDMNMCGKLRDYAITYGRLK